MNEEFNETDQVKLISITGRLSEEQRVVRRALIVLEYLKHRSIDATAVAFNCG